MKQQLVIKRLVTKPTFSIPRGVVYIIETSEGEYKTMFKRLKDAKEYIANPALAAQLERLIKRVSK